MTILTTKECETCGHVFLRYLDHRSIHLEPRREQKICPVCNMPKLVIERQHPGEQL